MRLNTAYNDLKPGTYRATVNEYMTTSDWSLGDRNTLRGAIQLVREHHRNEKAKWGYCYGILEISAEEGQDELQARPVMNIFVHFRKILKYRFYWLEFRRYPSNVPS